MLLEVTFYDLTKEQARQLLGITGNNVQAAVDKFYETDSSNLEALLRDSKPTWDETAFGGGRYGENDASGGTLPSTLSPHQRSKCWRR